MELIPSALRPYKPDTVTRGLPNPQPARVMLVDDDPACVRAIGRLLELRGLCVVGFDCAQAASEALAREHFDLMISDIEMAGMDGLELVGVLRNLKPQVPAILMSGHPDPGMAQLAIKAGADAFVPKQAGPVKLCDVAERVLSR